MSEQVLTITDYHRNVISGIAHYTAHVIVQEQPAFYGKVLSQNDG